MLLQLTGSNQSVITPETSGLMTERIRGEFREMPGLVLTAQQACRLWSLDMPTCTALLSQLIDAGFLCLKDDGTYARTTDLSVRPRMVKPGLQFAEIDRLRRNARS